ncbi:hypothetical protein KPH14_008715 [Odynerus spinipes]|uniref:DUF4485 domain-containing protein n=1 Tax=Odynerus spinipes TaxID=1348599 RepID=A0AAD9VIK0_9HYME|nr:hypothetical protein KPH14_008715 [Odynerus spinipes]
MEETSLRDTTLMYDEQFNENMKIAKHLLKHLHDKQEIKLATKWLVRVNDIKSPSLEVKRSRNAFLYYLLKVLKETVLKHRVEYKSSTPYNSDNTLGLCNSSNAPLKIPAKGLSQSTAQGSNINYYSKWSKNHRTYVAVRPLPEQGALIYMAVSIRPGLENWDIG